MPSNGRQTKAPAVTHRRMNRVEQAQARHVIR